MLLNIIYALYSAPPPVLFQLTLYVFGFRFIGFLSHMVCVLPFQFIYFQFSIFSFFLTSHMAHIQNVIKPRLPSDIPFIKKIKIIIKKKLNGVSITSAICLDHGNHPPFTHLHHSLFHSCLFYSLHSCFFFTFLLHFF